MTLRRCVTCGSADVVTVDEPPPGSSQPEQPWCVRCEPRRPAAHFVRIRLTETRNHGSVVHSSRARR